MTQIGKIVKSGQTKEAATMTQIGKIAKSSQTKEPTAMTQIEKYPIAVKQNKQGI